MAKDQKANKEADGEKEADLGKGKKKKIIIIAIVVFVLLLAGGAGYFFFVHDASDNVEGKSAEITSDKDGLKGEDGSVEDKMSAKIGNAIYVPMPKPFRFNVPGKTKDRLVEIRVQLLIRGTEDGEITKKHIPLIESTLLSVFSEVTAEDLMTKAGKESLKSESLLAIQEMMLDVEDKKLVEKVLFTGFVMQ